MSARIAIREARDISAETLAALHAESFGGEQWSVSQLKGSLALPSTKVWIAQENGTVVGLILFQTGEDEAEILTFCVSPSCRRSGIGTMLLRTAIKQIGATRIFLEVAADNDAAKALYEKEGFTVTGRRTNYYKRGAVTVDAVVYSLSQT